MCEASQIGIQLSKIKKYCMNKLKTGVVQVIQQGKKLHIGSILFLLIFMI